MRGCLLLPLQLGELLCLRRRLRLEHTDAGDDLVVLVGYPVQELRLLEHVGEAVRVEDDREDIGIAVLVHLDEARREDLLRLCEVDLQSREPVACLLELVLSRVELRLLLVERLLDPVLPLLQIADLTLQALNALVVVRDRGGEHAFLRHLDADLGPHDVHLPVKRRRVPGHGQQEKDR